jgi:predicted NBD/HSP70 family sugar kinase
LDVPSGERASYNFYRVLRSIWKGNGISRTELASAHALDKTTVSQIVSELTDVGIVRVIDLDTASIRPGRKSELLSVNSCWGMVAGMEIRPDGINVIGADMQGGIIAAHHHSLPMERRNLSDGFFQSLEALGADDRCAGRPLVGVGVGVSGIVHRDESVIVHSIPLNIGDPYDLAYQVSRHVAVPVVVDNDANCCAWGEIVYTKPDFSPNFLFVLLEFRGERDSSAYGGDIGLGLGFVFDGKVYYGTDGSAGEFRSLYWHQGYRNQFGIPNEESASILSRSDAVRRLVDEIAEHVALFVNTLNLKGVYVGGDVGSIEDLLLGTIRSAVATNWPYDEPVDCVVEVATHPRDTVAVGAAAMVLEHIFGEPNFPAGLQVQNSIWKRVMTARSNSDGSSVPPTEPPGDVVNTGR